MFDILDLAVHVFRINLVPLCLTMLIGALPWAIVDFMLLYWMVPWDLDAPGSFSSDLESLRYMWTLSVLIFLQAPLASAFSTVYIGQALFVERPTIRGAIRDVFSVIARLAWFHLFMRGILPAICLVAISDRYAEFSGPEVLLIFLVMAVWLRRATAPFLNEVILLERNPIRSSAPDAMTIRKRSAMLHGSGGGNVLALAIVVGAYAIALAGGGLLDLYFVQFVFFGDGAFGRAMLFVGWPLVMWLTATFVTVVRFLSYLDIRIRHEGWEVELRMRAEGSRLVEAL